MTRSLRSKQHFSQVYAEGVKRVGRYLVLYILPAEDDAFAVVASRRSTGDAVRRNRAKRLLREGLRPLFASPDRLAEIADHLFRDQGEGAAGRDPARGLWIVALARQPILTAKAQDVRNEIEQLLA